MNWRVLLTAGSPTLLLLLLVVGTRGGEREKPGDTLTATYVITYLDTTAYYVYMESENHRFVKMVCPNTNESLLVAEVWVGVPEKFGRTQRQLDDSREEIKELRELIRVLDSSRTAKGPPKR